jgi:endoglucanase
MTHPNRILLVAAMTVSSFALVTRADVLHDFDQPFLFSYGTWDKKVSTNAGVAIVSGEGLTNAGGAGLNVELDLSAHAHDVPAVLVSVGPGNKAKFLRLMLLDAAGVDAMYSFPLDGAGESYALIAAENAAALGAPEGLPGERSIDLKTIRQVQIQGDWAGNVPMDVRVDRVEINPATPEQQATRQQRIDRLTKERAARQAAREAALAKIAHTPNSPVVQSIYSAGPQLVGIHIPGQRVMKTTPIPYVAQEGDELEKGKHQVLQVQDGKLVMDSEVVRVHRKVDGQKKLVGVLLGSRVGPPVFKPAETLEGDPLETAAVDEVDSYEISSPDDAAYATARKPLAVHRKSVPCDNLTPTDQMPVKHTIYLKLSHPMQPGKTYAVKFLRLNTREPSSQFVFDSKLVRSEAVHAIHTGYHPADSYKRAFLSLWTGTGGAVAFDAATFELIDDATGATVFTGPVQLVLGEKQTEQLVAKKNYSQTNVYALDFSAFNQPGTYRVHVPGVGTSRSLTISDSIWRDTFKLGMMGFLHQRSGIELGPPLTDYKRPRNLHPADGFQVYRATASIYEAADGEGDWFGRLVESRTEEIVPDAWGGYADAGDFDRIAMHMEVSYMHLELAELFPKSLAKLPLRVPAVEANDALPDLVNEAMWNVDCFRRLQDQAGGVGGGIEASSHPRTHETSWNESLVHMGYASDSVSSYTFAATAAKLSRALSVAGDAKRADAFSIAATRAWTYALAHEQAGRAKLNKELNKYNSNLRGWKAIAALELYRLTRDPAYHDAFKSSFNPTNIDGIELVLAHHAAFGYAVLPSELNPDATLAGDCRKLIVTAADVALKFAEGNALGLTTDIPSLPVIGFVGYFSTPGMITQSVPRAHYLTGESRYLSATVRACNYALGANPNNITYTTGVGHDWPRAPLHYDSRGSAQDAPTGLVITGQSDPAESWGFNDWAHTWKLGPHTVPNSRSWPATEAYVDLCVWPSMNELMINQTMGRNIYWWGYLAGASR